MASEILRSATNKGYSVTGNNDYKINNNNLQQSNMYNHIAHLIAAIFAHQHSQFHGSLEVVDK